MHEQNDQGASAGQGARSSVGASLSGLGERPRRDWRKLARGLQTAFCQLWGADALRRDAKAPELLANMARARDIEELDCAIDLLRLRVGALRAAARGAHGSADVGSGSSRSRRMIVSGFEENRSAPRSRTFIRL